MVFGKEADEFKPSKYNEKYENIEWSLWLETVCESLRVSFDEPNFSRKREENGDFDYQLIWR